MFVQCPKEIYQNKELTPLDLRVYLTIQGFANSQGFSFPSVAKIADICGVSKRTIFRIIKKLSDLKIINRQHRIKDDGGYSSNLYLMTPVSLGDDIDVMGGDDIGVMGGDDIGVISNNNQYNNNINLKFIQGARARTRVKGNKFNKDELVLEMGDLNDVRSCREQVEKSKQYEYVKLKGGAIGIRPLSVFSKDEVLESQIIDFLEKKCGREVEILDFNVHSANELKINI